MPSANLQASLGSKGTFSCGLTAQGSIESTKLNQRQKEGKLRKLARMSSRQRKRLMVHTNCSDKSSKLQAYVKHCRGEISRPKSEGEEDVYFWLVRYKDTSFLSYSCTAPSVHNQPHMLPLRTLITRATFGVRQITPQRSSQMENVWE